MRSFGNYFSSWGLNTNLCCVTVGGVEWSVYTAYLVIWLCKRIYFHTSPVLMTSQSTLFTKFENVCCFPTIYINFMSVKTVWARSLVYSRLVLCIEMHGPKIRNKSFLVKLLNQAHIGRWVKPSSFMVCTCHIFQAYYMRQ